MPRGGGVLNGRSLGTLPINADASPRRWAVTYAPGEVRAVCRDKGAAGISDRLRTAGRPAAIRLSSDAATVGSGFDDMTYVRATLVDAKGETVPSAQHLLRFTVQGTGELIATDNGSVTDHRPFASPERQPRNGTAVALVRGAGEGRFTVGVRADGLPATSIALRARKER